MDVYRPYALYKTTKNEVNRHDSCDSTKRVPSWKEILPDRHKSVTTEPELAAICLRRAVSAQPSALLPSAASVVSVSRHVACR